MFDNFTRVSDLKERKHLQCNQCKRATIHTIEAQCIGQWSDYGGSGGSRYSMFRCGACDTVCYETSTWDDQDCDHDVDGNIIFSEISYQYPPSSSADFIFNTDFTPNKLDGIIDEMLYALAGAKMNLATIALRLVVEFIVNDKECLGNNLKLKIDDLLAKGIVDEPQHSLLHKIRIKGNAGAHTGVPMTKREMVAGMGVIDLLIEKLYNGPGRHAAAVKKAQQAFGD